MDYKNVLNMCIYKCTLPLRSFINEPQFMYARNQSIKKKKKKKRGYHMILNSGLYFWSTVVPLPQTCPLPQPSPLKKTTGLHGLANARFTCKHSKILFSNFRPPILKTRPGLKAKHQIPLYVSAKWSWQLLSSTYINYYMNTVCILNTDALMLCTL